jgi:GTPase
MLGTMEREHIIVINTLTITVFVAVTPCSLVGSKDIEGFSKILHLSAMLQGVSNVCTYCHGNDKSLIAWKRLKEIFRERKYVLRSFTVRAV